jgi:hypothetical protein
MTNAPLSTVIHERVPYIPLNLVVDYLHDERYETLYRQARARGLDRTDAAVQVIRALWQMMVLERAARHR